MKVCYIFRDPKLKGHSIEEIFYGISNYLGDNTEIEKIIFIYNSDKSIISNILKLRRINADIFHITGDIHYIVPYLFGKKVIQTIHDINTYKNLNGIKKWLYGLFWVKLPCFFSDKTTVISEFTKGELNKKNHPVLGVSTHWTTPNK